MKSSNVPLELLAIKYAPYILAGVLSYISPIVPALIFVGMLVMADWITGMIKGHRTKTFKSRKVIQKFYSGCAYIICILVVRMAEVYFGEEIPFVKPVVAIIALAELQSLRENIQSITGIDILKHFTSVIMRKSDPSEKNNEEE
jgi:hypothetical protein